MFKHQNNVYYNMYCQNKQKKILQVTWMKEGRPNFSSIIEGILIWNINQFRSKDRPQKCHWIFRAKKKKVESSWKVMHLNISLFFYSHISQLIFSPLGKMTVNNPFIILIQEVWNGNLKTFFSDSWDFGTFRLFGTLRNLKTNNHFLWKSKYESVHHKQT